jgi:hypothetical protein
MRVAVVAFLVIGSAALGSSAGFSPSLDPCIPPLAEQGAPSFPRKPEVILAAESLGFPVEWDRLVLLLTAVDHFFKEAPPSMLVSDLSQALPFTAIETDRERQVDQYQRLLKKSGNLFILLRRALLGRVLSLTAMDGQEGAGLWPQVLLIKKWRADLEPEQWLGAALHKNLYFKEIQKGQLVILGRVWGDPSRETDDRRNAAQAAILAASQQQISVSSVSLKSSPALIEPNTFVFEAKITLTAPLRRHSSTF